MAVPDFQTLMRPLLEEYATGGERRIADVRAVLATRLGLTEEELAERLPSGLARTFDNRVGWAVTHLYRVGALVRPRRSVYAITARGREVLAANPERVDLGVLSQFPELAEFRKASGARRGNGVNGLGPMEVGVLETETPEERIEAAYRELRQELIAEVRDRVSAISPTAFEDLVLDVLHAMGYGDGSEHSKLRTGASGDAGIDGVIREDRLGLDVVYVQAKRWEATVGRPVVQGFVGALQGARASKGIIFTASTFSSEAEQYAATVSPRVVLVDGERLAGLMIDHNVGVSDRATYAVKRVDSDYFGDES
jgi:restriction system protein